MFRSAVCPGLSLVLDPGGIMRGVPVRNLRTMKMLG